MSPIATPALELVGQITVFVEPAIEAGEVSGTLAHGVRRIIPIVGGHVSGRLSGVVLAGGGDFQIIASPTTAVLDARYILSLDDGARIYVHNRAIRRGSVEAIAQLAKGEYVDPANVYFRGVPTFEVSSDDYLWLTESIFIASGARFPDRVELTLFRLS